MKFEKLYNSKFYAFFETLYRLIVLNFIFLIFVALGLVVFSFIPAAVALIVVLRSMNHESEFPLVKTFYRGFIANFKKTLGLSGFFLLLGAVLSFNTYFFYLGFLEYQALVNELIFNFSLILDGIFIISLINACFIRVYFPNLNNRKTIKYSFVLLRAAPLQFILVFAMTILSVYVIYTVPIISLAFWMSLCFYVINRLLKNKYERLVASGVKSQEAMDFVR